MPSPAPQKATAPVKKLKGPPIEIWISKQGRAGKAVSLLKSNINGAEAQNLLVILKRGLAVGGALKNGEILLQTSDRPRVAQLLLDQGYASKICGG
jgi:translation initiation factor 1 (eIF-1/SUI1)